jgi:predicted nucleotidyltransferase
MWMGPSAFEKVAIGYPIVLLKPSPQKQTGNNRRAAREFLAYVLKIATIVARLRTYDLTMPKQAIELMFGAYRRKLLGTLFLQPDERYHVRELSRMTGVPAGSLHRELKAMAAAGLLVREQVGNQVLYRADQSCEIFEELASIFRKTTGLASLLRDELHAISDNIEFALVFGSMASGRQNSSSDVDVLVLGNLKLIEVVKALSPLGQVLKREINPVVMTTREYSSLIKKGDRFAARVGEEPKVFVIGDDVEFAKLGED